jgi:hypothetical protein
MFSLQSVLPFIQTLAQIQKKYYFKVVPKNYLNYWLVHIQKYVISIQQLLF